MLFIDCVFIGIKLCFSTSCVVRTMGCGSSSSETTSDVKSKSRGARPSQVDCVLQQRQGTPIDDNKEQEDKKEGRDEQWKERDSSEFATNETEVAKKKRMSSEETKILVVVPRSPVADAESLLQQQQPTTRVVSAHHREKRRYRHFAEEVGEEDADTTHPLPSPREKSCSTEENPLARQHSGDVGSHAGSHLSGVEEGLLPATRLAGNHATLLQHWASPNTGEEEEKKKKKKQRPSVWGTSPPPLPLSHPHNQHQQGTDEHHPPPFTAEQLAGMTVLERLAKSKFANVPIEKLMDVNYKI